MTPKENLYLKHYLVHLNQEAAARFAGYAHPHVEGHKVFHRAHMQKEIQKAMNERTKKLDIDAEFVLKELHELYRRVMQEVKPALNSKTGKAITDDDGNVLYTFNANAALKALELIGKHMKVDAFAANKVQLGVSENLVRRLHAGRDRANLIINTPVGETNGS